MPIRVAVPDDAASISALIHSLAHLFMLSPTGEGGEKFFASVSEDAMRGYITADNFAFWVAEEDGRLIGIIAMRDNGHLFNFFVAQGYQGRGWGRQLWQVAHESALARGNAGKFTVNASINAVPLYQHLGFVPTGLRVEQHGLAFLPMCLHEAPLSPGVPTAPTGA